MLSELSDAERRIVGTKQLLRALDAGKVARAYVARDADPFLTKRVMDRCYDMNIPCLEVESMKALGLACGIDVGAAAAGVQRRCIVRFPGTAPRAVPRICAVFRSMLL